LGVFGTVAFVSLLSYTVFTSVTFEPGRVVMHGVLYRGIVSAQDVERIELDPPVRTLSLEWRIGETSSALIIYRRGKPYVNCNAMPNGLKLRIANALQPENFALPSEARTPQ